MATAIQYWQPSGMGYEPQYLDLATGEPIPYANLPYYDVKDQSEVENGTAQLPQAEQQKFNEIFRPEGGDHQAPQGGSVAGPRSMSNNFGYAAKPGFMGVMGMMPGPVGMVGKLGSLAMNVNNRQAVQDARQVLGLSEKNNFGSFLSDNKGLVGNVNIQNPVNPDMNETVPVGFEASDKVGRTMMTPNEARNRALTNPGSVTEASKQDVKDANQNFAAQGLEAPKAESVGSKMLGNMFGSSYNTSSQDTSNHHVKGLGLGDVSPSFRNAVENGRHVNATDADTTNGSIAGVNYSHPERGDVSAGLTDRTRETISALATNTPGGINVSSAYRSPAINDAIGGAARSYHTSGQAFDVSTKGLTDDQKQDMVERGIMSGAMEIGTYGDQSLHMATDRRNPINAGGVAAMYNRTEQNAMQNAPGWFSAGVTQSRLAPTPTPRPSDEEMNMSRLQAAPQSFAAQERMNTPQSFAGQERDSDISKASQPANAASSAMDRYNALSDDDKHMMAMTLAGEIDPSKTPIGTDTFTNEAYGIAQTMDNRVGKYGTMAGVLGAPKQYSTWNNDQAAKTAAQNYNLNPAAYDNAIKGYYSSDENNQGFTNYHATNVNPGWGAQMQNSQQIGAHTFGTLPGYSPSQPTAVAVSPAPNSVGTPSLTNASAAPGGFSTAPSAQSNTDHFSGPSQTGPSGQSNSNSSAGGGQGGRSDGGAFGGASATGSGGFANSPSSDKSDNDNGRSGYSGSRSDGWN